MDELRQSHDKATPSASRGIDVLRAGVKKEFSTTWGNTVQEQREATKLSGQNIFEDVYRRRYREDPPSSTELPPHNGSPPRDFKAYGEAMIHTLREKQQKEKEHIHHRSQELFQKMWKKNPLSSEEIARQYEKRYTENPPDLVQYGLIRMTTTLKDTDQEVYESYLDVSNKKFTFTDIDRKDDREVGGGDPLHASNILRYHVKEGLKCVSEKEREHFRLEKIQFQAVGNKEMIDETNDFIPASGKAFTLFEVDEAGERSAAFEKLMTSPFGKMVSWALRDDHELLKSTRCHAITIRADSDTQIWKYEPETEEYTRKPLYLRYIVYHLE